MTIPTWVFATLASLSVVGLLNSLYLYISHVQGTPLACGALKGCDIVAASPYSELLGVPLSLFGVLYYTAMLILVAVLFSHNTQPTRTLIVLGAIIGALASAVFEYIQGALIGAWCLYCLLSAVITWCMVWIALRHISIARTGAATSSER